MALKRTQQRLGKKSLGEDRKCHFAARPRKRERPPGCTGGLSRDRDLGVSVKIRPPLVTEDGLVSVRSVKGIAAAVSGLGVTSDHLSAVTVRVVIVPIALLSRHTGRRSRCARAVGARHDLTGTRVAIAVLRGVAGRPGAITVSGGHRLTRGGRITDSILERVARRGRRTVSRRNDLAGGVVAIPILQSITRRRAIRVRDDRAVAGVTQTVCVGVRHRGGCIAAARRAAIAAVQHQRKWNNEKDSEFCLKCFHTELKSNRGARISLSR